MNVKRKYKSGSEKRKEKRQKLASSIENTRPLSTYFHDNRNSNEQPPTNAENEKFLSNDFPSNEFDDPADDSHADDGVDNDIDIYEDVAIGNEEVSEGLDLNNDFPTDRGHFARDVSPAIKHAILEHGPCRPTDEKYFVDNDGKKNFLLSYYRHKVDNVELPRQWLCYSPKLQKPYCEVCWLFAEHDKNNNQVWVDGVAGDIQNMHKKIGKHERSQKHIEAARVYGRWKQGKSIDKEANKSRKLNISFWTKVLHRIVSIILTLSSLDLAFRGHREVVHNSICEGGNFLGLVALVAQYDEILAELISFPAKATKYLCHEIQEEIITLLGNAVRNSLVRKINSCPFWSIVLDTTSDITRIDQLSVIIRWVNVTDNDCEIVESFLGFVEVTNADARGLVDTTNNYLKELGVDITRIRGQGYDGASVMSGIRGGVQKLIKDMCPSPVPFVHCASHNLNLVINDAVKDLPHNEKFFTTLQEIFNFFGNSLNRWRELQISGDHSFLTLKKLCTTRWTSRLDSVRALRDRYVHILKVLTRLSLLSENTKEKNIATGLLKKMETYEFIVFLVMWERILRAFHNTSRELQSKNMDLSTAGRLLKCTENELQHLRDNFESVLDTAAVMARSWNVKPSFQRANRYFFTSQRFINDIDNAEHFFKVNVYLRTLDVAKSELRVRFEGQNSVMKLFSFLYPKNLTSSSSEEIETSVDSIVKTYSADFSEEDLIYELRAFSTEFRSEISDKQTIRDLFIILQDLRLNSSFPQLHKLLLLFLTIPVTVASAERSFSKLKLIKTYLRSKMSQTRLSHLATLSIENDEAKNIDKVDIIRKFASVNAVRQANFGL